MIAIIKDVDLYDHVKEYDVTLLGANIYSTMKNGLQFDVKINYPYVYEDNLKTKYGDRNVLGTILESKMENQPCFCLCYIMGFPNARLDLKKDSLEYDSLEKCLKLVNILYKGKRVALPMLGCTTFDANGDRDKVMEIINNTLTDVDAFVYDYHEMTFNEKWLEAYRKGIKILETDGREAYRAYIKESKKRFKKK